MSHVRGWVVRIRHLPGSTLMLLGYLVLSGAMIVGFYLLWDLNREHDASIRDNTRALRAACALTRDLEERNHQAALFLNANPEGAFGLTAAQISANIVNRQATIDTLRPVLGDTCPPYVPPEGG